MKKTIVLIDNGHGTPVLRGGKQSPDGRLHEPVYCREIAQRVSDELTITGIDNILITPEEVDIPLQERVRRVNQIVKSHPENQYILLSIHNDAAGSGQQWMGARGWSVWVYDKASEQSKKLARSLSLAAKELGVKVRQPSPSQDYWTSRFYILKNTNCPAVLTENFFQDNIDDVNWLLSDTGKFTVVSIQLNGILRYLGGPCVVVNYSAAKDDRLPV